MPNWYIYICIIIHHHLDFTIQNDQQTHKTTISFFQIHEMKTQNPNQFNFRIKEFEWKIKESKTETILN